MWHKVLHYTKIGGKKIKTQTKDFEKKQTRDNKRNKNIEIKEHTNRKKLKN